MASMLARLAELRARRDASTARRPAVDPELAAAAAAAGSPTRGTWDADYIQRLRRPDDSRGASVLDLDSDEEEIVVLPPPQVKLDPVAQRAAWKKQMLHEARLARRTSTVEQVSYAFAKREIVLEQLTEEVDEEEEDERGEDCDDEAGDEHDADLDENDEGDVREDEEGRPAMDEDDDLVHAEPNIKAVDVKSRSDQALNNDGAHKDKSNGGSQECVLRHPTDAAGEEQLDTDEHEASDSRPMKSSVLSAAREARKFDLRSSSSPLLAEFIDEEAEDDDADATSSSDEEEIEPLDQCLTEDPDTIDHDATSADAAKFHQQWQTENDLAIIDTLAGTRPSPDEELPLENDNAIDVLDRPQRRDVTETGTTGSTTEGVDVCNSFSDTDVNEVEEMFRVNDQTTNYIDVEGDGVENAKELAEKREKALALWKARMKRNAMAAEIRDSCDLSRCSFLENDNDDKREQYRLQLERACGVNSRNAIAINRGIAAAVPSAPGHSSKNAPHGSSADRPIRLNQRASANRLKKPSPCVSSANQISEIERRKCIKRKLLNKRCSTSIGQWAYASEQNVGPKCSSDHRPAPTTLQYRSRHDATSMSLGPTCILPRKRSAASANVENAGRINRQKRAMPTKPATKIAQGLLDILGGRPQTDDH